MGKVIPILAVIAIMFMSGCVGNIWGSDGTSDGWKITSNANSNFFGLAPRVTENGTTAIYYNSNNYELREVNLTTGADRFLFPLGIGVGRISVNPNDGSMLVFDEWNNAPPTNIFVAPNLGDLSWGYTRIVDGGNTPYWADDGYIYYGTAGSGLWKVLPTGAFPPDYTPSDPIQVLPSVSYNGVDFTDLKFPSITSDGRLLFQVGGCTDPREVGLGSYGSTLGFCTLDGQFYYGNVWIANLDGSNPMPLTDDNRSIDAMEKNGKIFYSYAPYDISTCIGSFDANSGAVPCFEIWSMNIDGSSKTQVTHADLSMTENRSDFLPAFLCEGAAQVCGNGVLEDPETCDDGDAVTPDSCGIGACYREVADTCINSGLPDECTTVACVPGEPTTEIICNNIDENCNGMADDTPDSDGDGIDDCTDACPSVVGFKAPTEYVLEVLDFTSTASTVTAARVFAGNTEVFVSGDGKYHIPLKDVSGNFIKDNTNYNTLPKGVWVVDRQGAVEATGIGTSCAGGGHGGHGCYDNMKNAGVIIAGVRGEGLPSNTYVYYKAKATLNGDAVVRNTANNKFEKQGDGIAVKGNTNQDEFTVTKETLAMSILAESSVKSDSDYMKITFYDLQGCPYGDITNAVMHIVDQKKSGICGYDSRGRAKETCTVPLGGMVVKVYDRNDAAFKSAYGSNPNKNLYDNIFEADIGLVGGCTTAADGSCLAPEEYGGKFLVIGKYTDTANNITIYQARLKNFKVKDCNYNEWDCEGSCKDEEQDDSDSVVMGENEIVKTKNLRLVKIIGKYGSVKYEAGNRQIIIGSELNVISADYVVWENNQELYPFILTSDSNWTVDVCINAPAGYIIAGIMDIDGNILSTTECMQTFVEGESKVILFELAATGTTTSAASAPDVTATITGTPEGEAQKQTTEDIEGITKTESYTKPMPTVAPTAAPTTPAKQAVTPTTAPKAPAIITPIRPSTTGNMQAMVVAAILIAAVLFFIARKKK